MPKYYGGHDGMLLELASMSYLGCTVVVAGRAMETDQGISSFKTFEDVEVPEVIAKLVCTCPCTLLLLLFAAAAVLCCQCQAKAL